MAKKKRDEVSVPTGNLTDRKVDRRVLRFINEARAPGDLLSLRPNHYAEVLPPGRERPYEDDPAPAADPVPLFDYDTAEQLLHGRDQCSPIYGFEHLNQIEAVLGPDIFERLARVFAAHFSGSSYGEWTTDGNVTIGGETIVPRHAALLHTGNVLMIEGKCSSGDSRTWLWNPYARAMVTPAPAPPGNNLYCSGHTFLRDGRLLVYGGGGESNTPGPKNAAWIFAPDARSWAPNVKISGQSSKAPPALAAFDGKLHMVHLGNSSNNIWHSVFDETTGMWAPNVKISGQSSKAPPALAAFDGKLHMVHLGNSSNNIWHSVFDETTGMWAPNVKISGQSSKAPPALAAFDGKLHMVHLGNSSNNIWHSQFALGSWVYTRDSVTSVRTWGKEERWYPTLVTLGDERVLVASGDLNHLRSGCPATTDPAAMKMEIYTEATGRFEYVNTRADKFFRPTYPGLHLLPDNTVFFAPVGFRDNSELSEACPGNEPSALFSLSGLNGSWVDVGTKDRTKGMSVLLLSNEPPYVRVMIVGGGDSTPSRTYSLIDLSTGSPSWGGDLQLPLQDGEGQPARRIHPNVVLLPDGTVFVAGGAPASEPCWLYDPSGPGWAEMDELNFARQYHSFALLLPTAEVMACGGQGTTGESTIEVFRPPYLFRGPQPTITNVAPDPIHHGQPFTITTPNAESVARVTLVRPMAVTHQTDSEQRVIELRCAPGRTTGSIVATAPSPAHPHGLAPKGWYMLFIIDNDGVPSQARFVHLH